MKNLILIMGLCCLISGCYQKEDDEGGISTTVNLTILDDESGTALADERFAFMSYNSSWSLFNDETLLNHFHSDNTGTATFDFINEVGKKYELKYRPTGDWKTFEYMSPIAYSIEEGVTNDITIRLKPTVQLGLHFIHEASEANRLGYWVNRNTEGERGASDYLGFQGQSLPSLDQAIDTIIYYPVMQGEEYTFEGTIYENTMVLSNFNKSFTVPNVDTLVVAINF